MWEPPSMFQDTNMSAVRSRKNTQYQEMTNSARRRGWVDQDLGLQAVQIFPSCRWQPCKTTQHILTLFQTQQNSVKVMKMSELHKWQGLKIVSGICSEMKSIYLSTKINKNGVGVKGSVVAYTTKTTPCAQVTWPISRPQWWERNTFPLVNKWNNK